MKEGGGSGEGGSQEEVKAAVRGRAEVGPSYSRGSEDGAEAVGRKGSRGLFSSLVPTVQSASGKMAAAGHTRWNCRRGGSQEAAV